MIIGVEEDADRFNEPGSKFPPAHLGWCSWTHNTRKSAGRLLSRRIRLQDGDHGMGIDTISRVRANHHPDGLGRGESLHVLARVVEGEITLTRFPGFLIW